jgi:hypothetical protein
MDRLERIMGVILIVWGVWSLLHSDWLIFVMFTAWGLSFLIGSNGPKDFQGIRKKLLLVVLVMAVIGLIKLLYR